MVTLSQLGLLGISNDKVINFRGEELPQPQFDNFYKIYLIDDKLYRRKLKAYIKKYNLKGYKDVSSEVLRQLKQDCLILDEYGKPQPLGDEEHILHYEYLQKLYEKLYYYCNRSVLNSDEVEIIDYLVFYHDENQAEIDGTQQFKIREKIIIHHWFLRFLNAGISVKCAIECIYLILLRL